MDDNSQEDLRAIRYGVAKLHRSLQNIKLIGGGGALGICIAKITSDAEHFLGSGWFYLGIAGILAFASVIAEAKDAVRDLEFIREYRKAHKG